MRTIQVKVKALCLVFSILSVFQIVANPLNQVYLPGTNVDGDKNLQRSANTGRDFSVEAIADPDTICQGTSSQLNVIVTEGEEPYTYLWHPSTGLNYDTIANPLATPASTKWYKVTVTDNNLMTTTDSVLLTVMTGPPYPGPITGIDTVCQDTITSYEIDVMPAILSYSWSVPEDAYIVSGQNSPKISVLWGEISGTISVIVGNECGSSPPGTLEVTVQDQLPQPGTIFGPEVGCSGVETTFSIDPVPGAISYEWSVPADAQIITGHDSVGVIVVWGTTSGNISVVAQNICGNSIPKERMLTAVPIPGPAGAIDGNDTVCLYQTGYIYSVSEISDAITYMWSVPSGVIISEGQGTREITVDFGTGSMSGTISVFGKNECGDGNFSEKGVYVSDCSGINTQTLKASVLFYPNPVTENLVVEVSGKEPGISIELCSVIGKVLFQETYNAPGGNLKKTIDLSAFPGGLYLLRISNENRSFADKILILK